MQLVRSFRIEQIIQMRFVYCRMVLIGVPDDDIDEEWGDGRLQIGALAMREYGLALSQIRPGGTITCTFESWSHRHQDPSADLFMILREVMVGNDLMMTQLWKKEVVALPASPPDTSAEIAFVELQSLPSGSLAESLFRLPLTDKEYMECRALSPISAFRLQELGYTDPSE